MTTFTPPDLTAPAPPAPVIIQGDAFYPSINAALFQTTMRVASQVTAQRVRQALLEAMMEVDADSDLKRLRAMWDADGHQTLAAVPAPLFGGEHRLCFLYSRAIYNFAKASLDEKYRDNAQSAAGEARAEGVDVMVGSHLRNARNALSDLVGRGRSTIELL